MIKETQQQKDAKTIGLNISLSANAGTGKTTVLVDRYLALLESGTDISEIVAITFTKKAASEMIERITNKIDAKIIELSQASSPNFNKLLYYRRTRRKLSSAKISTIHSFCITILKDYALELGLEPNFKQLSDVEKFNIEQDSIASVLENTLQNLDTISEDNYYTDLLFRTINREKLEKNIVSLLKRADIFDDIANLYDKGYEHYEKLILQTYYDLTINFIVDFVTKLQGNYTTILEFKYNSIEERTSALLVADNILSNYQKITTTNSNDFDIENYFVLIKDILQLSNVKGGNRYVINKLESGYNTKIIEMLGNNLNVADLELYFYLSREIVNLTKLICSRIDEEKRYSNGIDFDDILILTRKLLVDNPLIANTISSEYKEIMVDEFQDTNIIQYDIIKALVPKLSNDETTFSPNIFIVGDPKQSIYRFRNADVAIFNEACKAIGSSNIHNNKAVKLNNGNLELTATFRMLPVVTGFINKVCSKLFDEVSWRSGIHYADLICGRDWEKYVNIAENSHLTEEFGSVNFLIFDEKLNPNTQNINKEEIDNAEEEDNIVGNDTILEGNLIANEINELVAERQYNYSDIAILYRSRTSVNKLKKALDINNIPYIEQGGVGFYEQPEIIQLVNYLKFLNNQQDDLALVGVLLSPFFALNNTDLFNIKAMGATTMWENLSQYNIKYQHDNIKNVFEILQKYIKLAPNLSIVHLINTILQNELWASRLHLLQSEQARTQVIDNIGLFISKAREFQSKNFVSLNDFIEEIDLLEQLNVTDLNFKDTATDAINLLTIHAAKGLEFPVIFLYNLNNVGNNNVFPVVNKTHGLGFSFPDLDNYGNNKETIASFVIKKEEAILNYFEELRLLYVGMTRAKNSLYLSADCSKKYHNSMMSLIVKGLGYTSIKDFIATNQNAEYIAEQINIKILNSVNFEVVVDVNFTFKCKCKDIEKSDTIKNIVAQQQATQANIQPFTTKINEQNSFFSFSKLNEFEKILDGNAICLTENIVKKLNFNDLCAFNSEFFMNYDNNYVHKNTPNYAIQKGVLYHNILAKINLWYTDVVNENLLLDLIKNELETMPELKIDVTDVTHKLYEITTTKLLQRYKFNFYNAKFEYGLTIPFENNFINGIIDCLIQNLNGEWEIWDWKTNYINNENRKEELEKNYKLQLELYLYLLMQLFPTQSNYTARLLFLDLALPHSEDDIWTSSLTLTIKEKSKLKDNLLNKVAKSLIKVTTC